MSLLELNVLVGTALTNEKFKEDLLEKTYSVLPRFDLTEKEQALVFQATGLVCFYADDPLTGLARVLANSETVRRDLNTITLGLNPELFFASPS